MASDPKVMKTSDVWWLSVIVVIVKGSARIWNVLYLLQNKLEHKIILPIKENW